MKKILSNIIRSFDEDRLHHAYLFSGPESVAKLECVEQFLSKIAVSNTNDLFAAPLTSDQILQKIKRGHHPDLLKIQAIDGKIGVDEVRVLGRALSFAPMEAKKRIVVIEKAEAMNSQAANAVLKVLEEPPHHTIFVLFCRDSADLLPTILSRCQEVRFPPPDETELMAALNNEFTDRDSEELQRAVALSAGSLERAKNFLSLEKSFCQEACENLVNYWERAPKIPSGLIKWAESISEPEQVNWVVDIWEALLRDLCTSKLGGEKIELIFPELRVGLNKIAENSNISAESMAAKKSAINRFRVYRELNGNLKLDLLALICDLNFSVGKRTQHV